MKMAGNSCSRIYESALIFAYEVIMHAAHLRSTDEIQ